MPKYSQHLLDPHHHPFHYQNPTQTVWHQNHQCAGAHVRIKLWHQGRCFIHTFEIYDTLTVVPNITKSLTYADKLIL